MAASTRIPNDGESEVRLSAFLSAMIKEYRVLVNKSQLPIVREMKSRALQKVRLRIAKSNLPKMNDKQIMKKIANMKTIVKKKSTTMKASTGQKHVLSHWEQELYDVIKGVADTRRATKVPSSVAVGSVGASSSKLASEVKEEVNSGCKCEVNSKDSESEPVQATNRTTLPNETEETASLSTMELQRLVLLEQLKCARMKIRRMERQDKVVHANLNGIKHQV